MMLLAASLFFYMCWKWEYIFLLFFPATIDFFVAQTDRENHTAAAKKLLLCISIVTNLGLLFYFKYFNFFWTALIQQLYYLEARPYCIVRRFFFPLGSPSTPFRV
ncbi:hypothetical protein [Pedobacter sp. P26]|uniref:hypothetical protein n=1 Tax=Pedobacter sp. P26 TaxID=3423956 RepID=UPI003D6753AB